MSSKERWISTGLGAGVVVLVVLLVVKSGGTARKAAHDPNSVSNGAAVTSASGGEGDALDAGASGEGPSAIDEPERAPHDDDRADSGAVGSLLPDGTPVPPLPEKAPRSVRFGVVLVTYAGASLAPADARPRAEAEALARNLARDAKADFHAAVARGDSGSADDLGRMPRGMLEQGVEYTLFTMAPGEVSEPVDTPRGFWIMRRID